MDSNHRNGGVKVRCLTSWLYPSMVAEIGFEPTISNLWGWWDRPNFSTPLYWIRTYKPVSTRCMMLPSLLPKLGYFGHSSNSDIKGKTSFPVVSLVGLEPTPYGLKIRCSTNWAKETYCSRQESNLLPYAHTRGMHIHCASWAYSAPWKMNPDYIDGYVCNLHRKTRSVMYPESLASWLPNLRFGLMLDNLGFRFIVSH